MNEHSAPIGIFDSGLGGLSVVREIRAALPAEDLLYLADSAFCPYGLRHADEIAERSLFLSAALVERGAKVVVIACNTACVAALELVRATCPVPVVGLEPAVKPAAIRSRTGKIGVLATPRTVESARFRDLVARHAGGVEVHAVAAPGLVELVESGETTGLAADETVDRFAAPLRAAGCDVVVLGCTHYPFLRAAVERALGPDVAVIDSGHAVARRVAAILDEHDPHAPASRLGSLTALTTGDPVALSAQASRLLGERVSALRLTESPPRLSSAALAPPNQIDLPVS